MKRYFVDASLNTVIEVDTEAKVIKNLGCLYTRGFIAATTHAAVKYKNMRYKTGMYNRCINHLINFVNGYDKTLHSFYNEDAGLREVVENH